MLATCWLYLLLPRMLGVHGQSGWVYSIHYEQIDVNCAKALDFCAWRQSEALCGKSIYVTTSKGSREKQTNIWNYLDYQKGCKRFPWKWSRNYMLLPTSFEIEGAKGLQVCGLCEALHGSKQLSHISITGSKCIQNMSPPEITEKIIFWQISKWYDGNKRIEENVSEHHVSCVLSVRSQPNMQPTMCCLFASALARNRYCGRSCCCWGSVAFQKLSLIATPSPQFE